MTSSSTAGVKSTSGLSCLRNLFCTIFLLLSALLVALAFFVSEVAIRSTPIYHTLATTPANGLTNISDQNQHTLGNLFKFTKYHFNPKKDLSLEYDEVEFASNEEPHLKLRGWWIPSESSCSRTIVLVHGAHVDRRDVFRHVPYLHKAGYQILMFDARDHGISDSLEHRGCTYGVREHQDIIAAINFLEKSKNVSQVALLGHSNGATSSIMAAIVDKRVTAVIADSPFSSRQDIIFEVSSQGMKNEKIQKRVPQIPGLITLLHNLPEFIFRFASLVTAWRLNGFGAGVHWEPIDRIHELQKPLFLLHSEQDHLVPYWHSVKLFEKSNKSMSKLWLDKQHSGHCVMENYYGDEYHARVLNFLGDNGFNATFNC